ncbi:MAG: MFS transporter [Propionibacteriaceae bacterium]|jgi:DHA1 family tetracycline resistance protein-like MFS transporter|nr:MFS transporter [Propionibacteriaceae bacterium]
MTTATEPRLEADGAAPTLAAAPSRRAWPLIIAIAFLSGVGMSIVLPVLPFITLRHISDESRLAWWVGVLEAAYALSAFLTAPLLGALSDRHGRRPVLIYSVFGAAVGYLLFGFGGSLWLLILARVVQGLASGDLPALFGYVADITPGKDRAKRFGFLGAVSGVAMIVGPAIGGALSRISLDAPVLATAGVSALIGALAIVVLPESLAPENRSDSLTVADLIPVTAIRNALARPTLRPLLLGTVLLSLPFVFFATNSTVLAWDTAGWGPAQVSILLTVIGVCDIAIQGGLLALLIPRIGERGVVIAGAAGQAVGCLGIALAASWLSLPWLLAGAFILFAACEGGTTAALQGLLSTRAGADEQGWLAGGLGSLSSAIQVAVPLLGGWIYAALGHGVPYWLGLAAIVTATVMLARATTAPAQASPARG